MKPHRYLAPSVCGPTVTWPHGFMGPPLLGAAVAWPHNHFAPRCCGPTITWPTPFLNVGHFCVAPLSLFVVAMLACFKEMSPCSCPVVNVLPPETSVENGLHNQGACEVFPFLCLRSFGPVPLLHSFLFLCCFISVP